jgi:hypothetical protein
MSRSYCEINVVNIQGVFTSTVVCSAPVTITPPPDKRHGETD